MNRWTFIGLLVVTVVALVIATMTVLGQQAEGGTASASYWLIYGSMLVIAVAGAGFLSLAESAGEPGWQKRLRTFVPPAVVPAVLLLLWQGLVIGFAVPKGIFPGVHHVLHQLQASLPVLLNDSYVTFVQEVALGLLIGVSFGFLAGVCC